MSDLFHQVLHNQPRDYPERGAVLEAVRRASHHPKEFRWVPLGAHQGERVFTTRTHLQAEQRAERLVRSLARPANHQLPRRDVETILARYATLPDDLSRCLLRLADGRSRLGLVALPQWADKTRVTTLVEQMYSVPGRLVLPCDAVPPGFAPGHPSFQTFTYTLPTLLKDISATPWSEVFARMSWFRPGPLREKLMDAWRERRPEERLDGRTVVVVQDAHLAGAEDLGLLAEKASRAGARLVLIGAERAEPRTPAAALFDHLVAHHPAHTVRLTHVRETHELWQRIGPGPDRIEGLQVDAATDRAIGLSLEVNEAAAFLGQVNTYFSNGRVRGTDRSLLVAESPEVVLSLNDLVQQGRLNDGHLGPGLSRWDGYRFHENDRVLFHRPDPLSGSSSREWATVEKIHSQTGPMTIALDSGRKVNLIFRTPGGDATLSPGDVIREDSGAGGG